MSFEIDDTTTLKVAVRDLGREQALEAANRAFSRSQEVLTQSGDELGYEVFPVVQSGVPPQWDGSEGAVRFAYTHEAAPLFEDGTQTHEIVADDGYLAFEWPDAPPEVKEMFESTFPTVFFKSVEVDGIEPIRFVDEGLSEAAAAMEGDR